MARIAGVDLPREKRVEIALTYIFGIGLPTSQRILDQTGAESRTVAQHIGESNSPRNCAVESKYRQLEPILLPDKRTAVASRPAKPPLVTA